VLKRWNPIIIAVIGSAGKTTTMSMIEAVLDEHISVKTSYKTNAASSIPLNILGLSQKDFTFIEWFKMLLLAPIKSFTKPKAKIYLCELDTDRSGEMLLHTKLIKPDICCWVSATPAHTQNFAGNDQNQVYHNMLDDQKTAAQKTKSLILYNLEDPQIGHLLSSFHAKYEAISIENNNNALINLSKHKISFAGSEICFNLDRTRLLNLIDKQIAYNKISLNIPNAIISPINCYGLGMAIIIGISFGISIENLIKAFKYFSLPPGRMSLFAGKYATTIIDSSYNASKQATIDALKVLKSIGNKGTLAILGDMRELGVFTQKEHEDLAQAIISLKIDRLILVGPQLAKYALPILLNHNYLLHKTIFSLSPKQAKEMVNQNNFLHTGETILVKGSQNSLFLEEIVKSLLVSAKDKQRLCRLEPIWEKKRSPIYEL